MIGPKKPMNIKAFRLEFLNALRKEGTVHRQALKPTVSNWKEKPTFESKVGLDRKGNASVITFPTGNKKGVQRFVWTDLGTAAHTIRARRAPSLRFRTGFRAKTTPGSFSSGPSRRFGPWRRPQVVRHPGTTPRNWSKDLLKQRQRPFQVAMVAAIHKAAQKVW